MEISPLSIPYAVPSPDNPCLTRLAAAIRTRDGQPLSGSSVKYGPPSALPTEQISVGCTNTSVRVLDDLFGVGVDVTYNRHMLSELSHHYGPVEIGFTPNGVDDQAALMEAVSKHFKRSIAVVDIEPNSFTTLFAAPNGKYTIHLRAAAGSYGWIGDYSVVFRTNVDLTYGRVVELPGFVYIRPPRPTDPDLGEAVVELNGFTFELPIDLSSADVTELPGFTY